MRLLRTASAIVAAAGLLAAAPGAAGAAQPGQILSDSALGPAVTDGRAAIAFAPSAGRVRALDARGRVARDVDVSSACLTPPDKVTAVGGGQVVFSCHVGRGTVGAIQPRRLDVATGQVGTIASAGEIVESAATAASGPGQARFGAIGTHGVYASLSGGRLAARVAVDWRTGIGLDWRTLGADGALDLDAPTLRAELCAPVRRTPMVDPFNEPDPYYDFVYAPPLALSIVDDDGQLELRRCGTTRAVTLAERDASGLQLGGGIATWTVGGGSMRPRRFAYLPACSAAAQLSLPEYASLGHVENALVVSSPTADDAWEIRRIPVDGACGRVDHARRLQVRAQGRSARTLRAVAGRFLDGPSRMTVTLPSAAPSRARIVASGGQPVRLVTGARAGRVRWRVGAGSWKAARGNGHTWSVRAPAVRHALTRPLTVDVRFAGGGSARFSGRLHLTRGG